MNGYRISYPFWIATKLLLNKKDRTELFQAGILFMIGEIEEPELSKRAMLFWPAIKRAVRKCLPWRESD